MSYLKKLHERKTPPGLELVILKKLPSALLASTMIPLLVAVGARLFPPEGTAAEVARRITMVDILSIATGITLWTAVFTVAIGCVVVHLMKGPAYVADAYPLERDNRPDANRHDDR